MKIFRIMALLFFTISLSVASDVGGDDAGNGGFAHKVSIKLLKEASQDLIKDIRSTTFSDIVDFDDRKAILLNVVAYDKIVKEPKAVVYRNNRLLAMDYSINPQQVKVYKAFYDSFAGTLEEHYNKAIKEIKKRLMHEASHIWGFNERLAEDFSVRFINHSNTAPNKPIERPIVTPKLGSCACLQGKPVSIGNCKNFCALTENMTSNTTLFVEYIIDEHESNTFKNLHDWCYKETSPQESPTCFVELKNRYGNIGQIIPTKVLGNKVLVNIDTLQIDENYRASLVSSTGVRSNAMQFRLFNDYRLFSFRSGKP